MDRKYTFLQPTYYKDFECTGQDCTFNCCNYNWNIHIDKNTYEKYRRFKGDKEFVEKLNKYIKRNRRNKTSNILYAKIKNKRQKINLKLTSIENGEETERTETVYNIGCIFQDENGLCEIYKNMGEESLSNTCKSFPRVFNNIFGNYERALNISCEEVSKLLYNQKDGVIFELVEINENENNLNSYLTDLSKNKSKVLEYFDNIRVVCISILQLKNLSLDNRMILLGVFMLKVDELVQNKQWDSIEEYIEGFFANISIYEPLFNIDKIKHDQFLEMLIKMGILNSSFGRTDILFDIQNILINLIKAYDRDVDFAIKNIINDKGQIINKYLQDIKKNIEHQSLTELENGSVVSELYLKYVKNREEFMEGKEYYLENIFVNIFFSKGYPFNGRNSIKDCYIRFIWSYCYYKGLLASYLAERNKFDEDLLHRISTIFGRVCSDQEDKLDIVLNEIKENGLDTLAFLAILIKSA